MFLDPDGKPTLDPDTPDRVIPEPRVALGLPPGLYRLPDGTLIEKTATAFNVTTPKGDRHSMEIEDVRKAFALLSTFKNPGQPKA